MNLQYLWIYFTLMITISATIEYDLYGIFCFKFNLAILILGIVEMIFTAFPTFQFTDANIGDRQDMIVTVSSALI